MGWPLPIIALVFMAYAMFGPYFPGLLKHAGNTWPQIVNHMYLTSQGVYGVAVGVVATYVFHFVLFGVLATRIGLGQLFLDVASTIAGRYAGGPARCRCSARPCSACCRARRWPTRSRWAR